MNVSKLLHYALFVAASSLASTGFATAASVPSANNTVILVHGAWADASAGRR